MERLKQQGESNCAGASLRSSSKAEEAQPRGLSDLRSSAGCRDESALAGETRERELTPAAGSRSRLPRTPGESSKACPSGPTDRASIRLIQLNRRGGGLLRGPARISVSPGGGRFDPEE